MEVGPQGLASRYLGLAPWWGQGHPAAAEEGSGVQGPSSLQQKPRRQKAVVGESGDVSSETVSSWKESLAVITAGYKAEDIYNLDEIRCFWKALPDHGFRQYGKQCKGGKKSKQRFTIALIANAAAWRKEKHIVIWKFDNPRFFKGIDKKSLPVRHG